MSRTSWVWLRPGILDDLTHKVELQRTPSEELTRPAEYQCHITHTDANDSMFPSAIGLRLFARSISTTTFVALCDKRVPTALRVPISLRGENSGVRR